MSRGPEIEHGRPGEPARINMGSVVTTLLGAGAIAAIGVVIGIPVLAQRVSDTEDAVAAVEREHEETHDVVIRLESEVHSLSSKLESTQRRNDKAHDAILEELKAIRREVR